MKNKFLKLLACLLAAAMLMTTAAASIFADADDAAPEDAPVLDGSAEDNNTVDPADDAEAPVEDGTAEDANTVDPADDAEAPVEDGTAEDDNAVAPDEGEEEAPAEGEEGEEAEEEEEEAVAVPRTDEEAIAGCQIAAENDKFILYYNPGVEDAEREEIGVYVKESGYMHWFTPINALCDDATDKDSLKENRLSNLSYKYGNATDQIKSSAFLFSYRQSTERGNTQFEVEPDGLKVTYRFNTANAIVPMHIKLEEDSFYCYIDTKEIKENSGYRDDVKDDTEAEKDTIVLTEIAMIPYMSAATSEDNGYMLIPDGSGAIIRLNNGKGNYRSYTQDIYGRDITQVKEIEPDQGEQAYLPVLAMVKGSNGLLMVAEAGDTFAAANANVSYSKDDNSWYNNCYFSFTIRSVDEYYMTGDSSAITVFEKGDGSILVPEIGVRYYPITSDNDEVTLGEIADVYRNDLIKNDGLKAKDTAGDQALYVDFHGGTLKSKSILGIPIKLKTSYTSFKEATEIVDELSELGVDNLVVNYNDWTNDSMSSKLDVGSSPAGCLGGKSAYKKMLADFKDKGVDYYATVSGVTFKSNGNGFWTLFNTAYRVSKSFSRQYTYNIAYGTPDTGVAAALMSPRSITKLSDKVTKNLGKYEQGAGLGIIANTLWSDFSTKYRTNRCTTAENVIEYYKAAAQSNGKVIADSPNAYLIPYVDRIQDLTLQSSQYKVSDYDVPFYQILLHGYVDYASEPINGTADTEREVLKAIAAGSNLHFDFIYEEASKLVNTDYVDLYYANYSGWLDEASKAYKLCGEVMSGAKGATISDYTVDGDVITTVYSNGYTTEVNLATGDIKAGGKTYNYTDYVKGGLN